MDPRMIVQTSSIGDVKASSSKKNLIVSSLPRAGANQGACLFVLL